MGWLFALPANLVIDFLVLWLTMRWLKIENRNKLCKESIFSVWFMGFVADLAGAGLMFTHIFFGWDWANDFVLAVQYNPFLNIYGFIWVTICFTLSAAVIYIINRKICLKRLPITDEQKHKIALSLAVFTAPYLFYLPTVWS